MIALAMTLGVKITCLVELVLNEKPIAVATNRDLTTGEVFYMNFRVPIVQQIEFSYKGCLGRLLRRLLRSRLLGCSFLLFLRTILLAVVSPRGAFCKNFYDMLRFWLLFVELGLHFR